MSARGRIPGIDVRPDEWRALGLSFAYFFLLLCSYYILRPVRDALGAAQVEKLPWFFTGTFITMLVASPAFSALAARFPPRRLVPWVYRFFIASLLGFYPLLASPATQTVASWAFFVWLSVYALFVVSIFWSVMADLFDREQAKRLYGAIAAGGTLGALTGPLVTALLAKPVGPLRLMLLSAVLLELAVQCVLRLSAWRRARPQVAQADAERIERAVGGGILAGLARIARSPTLAALCAYVFLLAVTNTFLYFEQQALLANPSLSPAERTTLLAKIDLFVNALTVTTQLLVTGQLLKRLGVAFGVALLPVISVLGFLALAAAPTLWVLTALQGLRRAVQYAIERPSRELLFTVVPREDKYKAKNAIDTVVFRGGDALSGWAMSGLKALGLSMTAVALLGAPVALLWLGVGAFLGRRDRQNARSQALAQGHDEAREPRQRDQEQGDAESGKRRAP